MKRKQILTLLSAIRSSCPKTNSVCNSVSLQRSSDKGNTDQEEFDLKLKWVPDEPSWTFLKTYALQHNIGIKVTGKLLTLST